MGIMGHMGIMGREEAPIKRVNPISPISLLIPTNNRIASFIHSRCYEDLAMRDAILVLRACTGNREFEPWHGSCLQDNNPVENPF